MAAPRLVIDSHGILGILENGDLVTEKVVSITGKGDPVKDLRKVDQHVVKMLEGLLALAETGELVGFSAVVEYHTALTQPFKVGIVSHAMIGRWEALKLKIIEDLGGY
jgi:hypothetical protein